ncbi:MAG TPA: UDP-N-acetylmuramoyl-L-alanyl-D-glutamate--2,6-diaminopimelate ligase [Actinomycetota bacterium]|nr:UDP-N-acetylmuramoyl-L-alanyl-D-glutamate--2,6-diaminopimelate ligase [Actinomycetota bacterium]
MASATRPLSEVLAALPGAEVRGDPGVTLAGIAYRSSDVGPGWLFFCVPGERRDGHGFAGQAAAAGAAAVVVERWVDVPPSVVQVRVPSVRRAMGPAAAAFHGRPADRLLMVGVTGTNGKTTTTYLLERIFERAGLRPGVIGTTGVRIGGRPLPHDRTTPEAPDLHRLLAEMVAEGVVAVAMEVSSHGLDQHRVGGARFRCAVFTNLSQDHLDYHGTLEDYFRAKARLFTPEMAERAAVNHDSPDGRRLIRGDLPTLTYGTGPGADLRATDIHVRADGVAFRAGGVDVSSPLRGAFNVHNCLAAMAAARQVGIDDAAAAAGIAALGGVPGRLEAVEAGQPFQVLVDYAHTPDSVENVLLAARPLAGTRGRVIVVLGCGGDRDRAKRPLMGEAATRLADLAVITSDNPRSEDPVAIIREIEPGAARGGGRYEVEPDRRAAIRRAVEAARPDDVVVIAGKGHEAGQEFADRTVPFDDRVVAREELEALQAEAAP